MITHRISPNEASAVSPVRAHGLFLLLASAYFLSIFLRTSAAVVMPAEAERLGMSASLIGFLSSLHFYSYAFMQPVSGILHDRFGPLRVTAAGMLLAAISSEVRLCATILSAVMERGVSVFPSSELMLWEVSSPMLLSA